jgi:transposase
MSQDNNPTDILYFGCDVAKKHLALDPALLPKLPAVANDAAGHQKLLRALQARAQSTKQIAHLIVEATGGYEQAIVDAAQAAQLRVSVIMPRRIRAHATALGQDTKTDPIDAAMISSYARMAHPAPAPVPTETERQARALSKRRRQLMHLRNKEKNRQAHELSPMIVRSLKTVIAALTKEIKAIDAALAELRQRDPVFAAKVTALSQINSVGEKTALAVLAAVPELGTMGRRPLAKLAGLAPFARDSGEKQRRRFIAGGRAEARAALYMAAVTASHRNPVLAPVYKRLRAALKPVNLARTALMRRLLIHMNSVLRQLLATLPEESSATESASLQPTQKLAKP